MFRKSLNKKEFSEVKTFIILIHKEGLQNHRFPIKKLAINLLINAKARIARRIFPKAIGLSMCLNAVNSFHYFALQPGVAAEDAEAVAGRSK